tara:strand:- start:181 stop:447 length:267 start_codon:yes stop_codon:yes gene_type:complete
VAKNSRREYWNGSTTGLILGSEADIFGKGMLRDIELSELNKPEKNLFNGKLEFGQFYPFGDDLWLKNISNMVVVVAGERQSQHQCLVS